MAYNNQLSMRKVIFTSFLLLFSFFISAQETTDKISLQLSDATLKSAIETLESKTNFKFYFDSKWIASDNLKITKNYQEKSIDEILTDLLDATDLNYFVDNNSIILTKNTSIITDLEKNLIETPTEKSEKKVRKRSRREGWVIKGREFERM